MLQIKQFINRNVIKRNSKMENTPFITIHTVTYNEEVLMEFFVKHYQKKFPNCIIKVWDNYSTDNTVEIAKSLGCEIFYYDSGGYFDERFKNTVQNTCWKDASTNWVIVCDCDELLDIDQNELELIDKAGANIVKFEGFTLVNRNPEIDLPGMKMGFRDTAYDKPYLFKKSEISEMNFCLGCHVGNPTLKGHIKQLLRTGNTYKAFHYKYLSLEYSINRRKLWAARLSDWAKKAGASFEVLATKESLIKSNQLHLDIEHLYTEQHLIQVMD